MIDKGVDVLALVAHPDDAEIGCGGTLLAHRGQGKKVGIVDLTRGEAGTRGTAAIRTKEAKKATEILGLSVRENLGMKDGFLENNEESKYAVIACIRKHRPAIVLTNAVSDRHPDHVVAAQLVRSACFLSGLEKIITKSKKKMQAPWRPTALYHLIQSDYTRPHLVVDVSAYWEQKMRAVYAFASQFERPQRPAEGVRAERSTFVSSPDFMATMEERDREMGLQIRAKYGEGFTTYQHIGVRSFFDLT